MRSSVFLLALVAALATLPEAAAADDFYQGKTIRMIVPSAPGGGYDAYGRAFVPFFRKHIPGEPNIVVQNMPGGGGLQAANWLFTIAPRDGLVFGLLQRGTPFYPYFGDEKARFVPSELNRRARPRSGTRPRSGRWTMPSATSCFLAAAAPTTARPIRT